MTFGENNHDESETAQDLPLGPSDARSPEVAIEPDPNNPVLSGDRVLDSERVPGILSGDERNHLAAMYGVRFRAAGDHGAHQLLQMIDEIEDIVMGYPEDL